MSAATQKAEKTKKLDALTNAIVKATDKLNRIEMVQKFVGLGMLPAHFSMEVMEKAKKDPKDAPRYFAAIQIHVMSEDGKMWRTTFTGPVTTERENAMKMLHETKGIPEALIQAMTRAYEKIIPKEVIDKIKAEAQKDD